MKPPAADDMPTSVVFFLCIFSYIASTVALTIPTTPSLVSVNTSHILPSLFPSLNATSLDAGHFHPHCTLQDDDQTWYNEHALNKWRYYETCYEAIRLFNKEDDRHGEQQFEFVAPGAQPLTQLRTMQTPRRYTFGGSGLTPNPSCTIIVAMLDFASPGQLPQQPPGPFPPRDVASFDGLLDSAGEIFTGCVQKRGVGLLPDLRFGWVRAGNGGNIAVLFTGTKSQIDRSIPRGIHP